MLSSTLDVLWKVAQNTMAGCREWMLAQLDAGQSFRFARSLVAKTGQLEASQLMVATTVTEFLLTDDRFAEVLQATRDAGERSAAMEEALGVDLPAFDEEWIGWLRGNEAGQGIVQALGGAEQELGVDPAVQLGIVHLESIRKAAFEGLAADRHHPFKLYPGLSSGAAAHARYLVQNPAQKSAWPDAHEEWLDASGFSPEGARAGLSSVINFTGNPVSPIDSWMATFYHRLPLIERHLYGIGIGVAEDVVVLDAGSLSARNSYDEWIVWPPRDREDVPRSFAPELPNPVPGEDQTRWGYPITLQLGRKNPDSAAHFQMTLRDADGQPVDCWFISPDQPYFAELAPPDVWCLIPKQTLGVRERYVVKAEWLETGHTESWSFRTGR